MRKYIFILLLTLPCYSLASKKLLAGKSNFDEKSVESIIIMLKTPDPHGKVICTKVDQIFPKILQEKMHKNGKIYSKEKWFLSGCERANSVEVELFPSGLVGMGKAKN